MADQQYTLTTPNQSISRPDGPKETANEINSFLAVNTNCGLSNDSPGACTYTFKVAKKSPPTPVKLIPLPPPDVGKPSALEGDSAQLQGGYSFPTGGNLGVKIIEVEIGDYSDTIPSQEPTRPPEGEPDPNRGGEKPQKLTTAVDPVDLFNGAFYLQVTDLEIPNTLLPLSFIRTYNSGAPSFGPFGWNWDHNYNLFIRELNTGDIALWRNLHEDHFVFDGTIFQPPNGVFEKLERVSGLSQVFEISGEGGIIMHFEHPLSWSDAERIPITFIKDRHGNTLNFSYDYKSRVVEVRDDDDRFFHFDYDACGLLVSVSDHTTTVTGRKFIYQHDEEMMHLVKVISPPITDHPKGISRIYHYADPWLFPELRHNIVRVEDSEGNVYLENNYQEDPASWDYARVTEQRSAGYLYQLRYTELQWVPPNAEFINIPSVRVEVMNPDFGLETYTFNYRGDLLDRRYRLNKDGTYNVVIWQYEFDGQGNLSKVTKPDGSQEINRFAFDPLILTDDPRMRGKLLSKEITAADLFPGTGSRFIIYNTYEPTFQLLIESKNESKKSTRFKYDFNLTPGAISNSGKLMQIIHPDVTLPDGTPQSSIVNFENNSRGQLTATILPDGTRNEIEYETTGINKSRVIKTIQDVGDLAIKVQTKYDAGGFVNEVIDGNGNFSFQHYDALGLIEKMETAAIGGKTAEYKFHFDSDKNLISSERPKGDYTDAALADDFIVDAIERDVLGYPTKMLLSTNTTEGRIIKIKNDFRGLPVQSINPDGSTEETRYDERGLLISKAIKGVDGNIISAKKIYDRSGNLRKEIDAAGLKTEYNYDAFSRLYQTIMPNGTEIINTWKENDLITEIEIREEISPKVFQTLSKKTFAYDDKNRKITETVKSFTDDFKTAVDITTTFFYDKLDRIEKIIDNRGGIRTMQYDGVGRLVIETDPMGNKEHYSYDNNNNLIQTESHHIEPDGIVSVFFKKFTFDARNRQIESIEPDGTKSVTEYDDRDLIVKQTDYLGISKEINYNSFGNIINETHDSGGLNILHQWTHNNMGRLTSYIDPTGQVSKYTSDGIGRVVKTEYPNEFSSTRIFNTAGQITEEKLGSGVVFKYDYDTSNRLTAIENTVFPSPINQVPTHSFSYDALNRLVSAKTGANEVLRAYDSQSRLISETTLGTKLSCSYDDKVGTVEKVWADGRTEKYTHNLNGVVTQIEETAGGKLGAGPAVIASFIPSGANFFGNAKYQGGIEINNRYDERKRLVEVAISSPKGIGESFKYLYDKANRKRVESIHGQNPKNSIFDFDNIHRFKNAKDGFNTLLPIVLTQSEEDVALNSVISDAYLAVHEESYQYDNADARIKFSETGSADKNYSYLPGHRLQNDGINSYSYFADGVLQNDGHFNYDVDAFGRIIGIKSGASTICSFEYDAFNRPSVIKEIGKPEKSFNYLGGFVEQENENGIPSRQKTLHPDTGVPIAYHSALGTHYTFFDVRFNLVGLADTSGALLETYRYKSFGIPEIADSSATIIASSAFGIEPVFGGQRFLSSVGLYISKRRLMNPVNGVFISADPKGYIDSSNLYAYVAQNPIDFIDPNGLDKSSLGTSNMSSKSAFAVSKDHGFFYGLGKGILKIELSMIEEKIKNINTPEHITLLKEGIGTIVGTYNAFTTFGDDFAAAIFEPSNEKAGEKTAEVMLKAMTIAGTLASGGDALGGKPMSNKVLEPKSIEIPHNTAAFESVASKGGSWIRFSLNKKMAEAFKLAEVRAADPYLPALDKKWGSLFGNEPLENRLTPELPNALGPYSEYTAYPGKIRLHKKLRGLLRIVKGRNGEIFTSWTHYGTEQTLPSNPLDPLERVSFLRSR